MDLSALPGWRAFGPGAARLLGWDHPRNPLPRTSLRSVGGQGMHWSRHLTRLHLGALNLEWDVCWLDEMEPEIEAWIATTETAVCRLQLFPDAISIRLEAIPEHFSNFQLLTMPHPLGDIRADSMAAHKGLLGTWDIQARNRAQAMLADDSLLLWPDGTIAETSIATLGLQLRDKLLLPPLEGRVAGITEAIELPFWAMSRGLEVKHRPIHLDEVSGGQLWCMNAVRGLWQAEVVQV